MILVFCLVLALAAVTPASVHPADDKPEQQSLEVLPDTDGVQRATIIPDRYSSSQHHLHDAPQLHSQGTGRRVVHRRGCSGGQRQDRSLHAHTTRDLSLYLRQETPLLQKPSREGDGRSARSPVVANHPQSHAVLDDILKRVSRSFYLTIKAVPASVRRQIGVAYLFARAADTIADTDVLERDRRLVMLKDLKAQFAGRDVEYSSIQA